VSELDLARWQFGITTVYRFIFVPRTLGLSLLVAGMQTAWMISKDPDYLRLTKFFCGRVTSSSRDSTSGSASCCLSWAGTRPAGARGSALPALLWGVAFASIVRGVPLNAAHVYTGNLLTLLNPYGLLGGLATLTLFILHGAIFLSLKTTGDLRQRAHQAALRTAAVAVPVAAAFLVTTQVAHGRLATDLTAALAAVALLAAALAAARGREGWAFAGTAVTLVLAVATLFGDLWPNVLPFTTAAAYSLTVHNASSSHYTLTVMTWVALIFTPVVLAYQGWTYWVFRHRVTGAPLTPPKAGPARHAPSGP